MRLTISCSSKRLWAGVAVETGSPGAAGVDGVEVGAPFFSLDADAGGEFPLGDVGNFVAVLAAGVDVIAAAGEGGGGVLEFRAGPGGGEVERDAVGESGGPSGVVLGDGFDAVDLSGAGVALITAAESGVGGNQVVEVGEEAGEFEVQVIAAVADAEFVADGFLLIGPCEVGTGSGRADTAVDAAEERVAIVELIVRAEAGGPQVFVAAVAGGDAGGVVGPAVVEFEPFVADTRAQGEIAGFVIPVTLVVSTPPDFRTY